MEKPAVSAEGFYQYDKNNAYPFSAEGFFAWMNHVKPMMRSRDEAGLIPIKLFPWQEEYVREGLGATDDTGRLKYGTCFACVPRGEGGNFINILWGLFRFFNGYAEEIKIAGSQHLDTMGNVIKDTPKLNNFPGLCIQSEEIGILQGEKDFLNTVKVVSKSSGICPDMTFGILSELHDYSHRDRKFYINFLSSMRGCKNAQVAADSLMAGTIMKDEYKLWKEGKTVRTYFHYRTSDDGYQNPNITPEFIEEERHRFTEDEFRMYWENKP